MGWCIALLKPPRECSYCPLEYGVAAMLCGLNKDRCAITEVAVPHGRLVDMSKALEVIAEEWGYESIEGDIGYRVPTVIEREK